MTAFVSAYPREVEEYAQAVRACLDDLPAGEREELVEDLRQHLVDVAADGGERLTARLGPPAAYAAELRASAGLPPRSSPAPAPADVGVVARVTALVRSLQTHPLAGPVMAFAVELRPGWWIARAVALVAAAVLATRNLAVVVLVLAAAPLSVALGRAAVAGRRRLLSAAVSVAGAVAALMVGAELLSRAVSRPAYVYYREVPSAPGGLRASDGRPIFNIYPFAADGSPLEDVLLYDQDGVPITNVAEATVSGMPLVRTYDYGADGRPLAHSYPQRVVIPESPRGPAREDQRPAVSVPPVSTTAPPATP